VREDYPLQHTGNILKTKNKKATKQNKQTKYKSKYNKNKTNKK
jgi:hypothetical protein